MISCDQHDYIEIACAFSYPIKLTLRSGAVIECIALDTELDENKNECIKVDIKGTQSLVVLDDISIMEVCVNNPHFHTVNFNSSEVYYFSDI